MLLPYSLTIYANSDSRKQLDNRIKKVWDILGSDGTEQSRSRFTHDISNAKDDCDVGCSNEGDFTRPEEDRSHVPKPAQLFDLPVIIVESLGPITSRQAMPGDVPLDSGKRKTRPISCEDEPARKRQKDKALGENSLELNYSATVSTPSTDCTQEEKPDAAIPSSSEAGGLDSDSTSTPTTRTSHSSLSTPETIRWSQQLKSYLQISQQISTSVEQTKVDLSCPVHQYTEETMLSIRKAADFLFSCALYEDAFPLYLFIYKKEIVDPQPPKEILRALIACARSAATDTDMKEVRDMLKSLLDRKDLQNPSGWLEFECFIIRLLIATVSIQLSQNMFLSPVKVMSIFPNINILLKRMKEGLMELDLTTYWYTRFCLVAWDKIDMGLIEEGYPVGPYGTCQQSLLKTRQHLLEQDPGPFALGFDNINMKNRCLRECLNWCNEELEFAINVRNEWKSLRQQALDARWADSMAIYLFLWSRWNQLHEKHIVNSWFAEMEKFSGISTAEFLNTVSFLVIKANSNEKEQGRVDAPRYLQDKDGDVLQRACAGARLLFALPDNKLAGKFLDHYVGYANEAWPPSMPSPRGRLNRISTRNFIQTALSIRLPELPESSQQNPVPSSRPPSAVSHLSSASSFALSLTASSISSIRKQALDISRRSRLSKLWWLMKSSKRPPSLDELSDTFSLTSMQENEKDSPELMEVITSVFS